MIDGLHPVRVPTDEEEALRDLVRAREDLRGDLMRARHRMGKLLLRDGVRYDGEAHNWTWRDRWWLGRVRLTERGDFSDSGDARTRGCPHDHGAHRLLPGAGDEGAQIEQAFALMVPSLD